MRVFCGWIGMPGNEDGRATALAMLGLEKGGIGVTFASGSDWLLALQDGPGGAELHEEGDTAVLMLGAPRSRQPGAGDSAASVVARRWMSAGAPLNDVPDLSGQFALAGIHAASRTAALMTDRFATHSIYAATVPQGMVFGSSPSIVAGHPMVHAGIRPQALFDFMYANVIPAPLTIYSEVDVVRGGYVLRSAGGTLTRVRHWQPGFVDEGRSHEGTKAEQEVLDLLRQSVSRSLHGKESPGCFLSGGMDSSTVVGCVNDVTGSGPSTFSIGFDAQGYDEMDYARLVARHFGAEHREYYVTPEDILDVVPRIARAFGQPFGNASVVPAFLCARLARDSGVTTLLAGDGGDELFGGNERYGRNWVYSLYDRLPRPVCAMSERWARAQTPLFGRLPVMRKAVSYVRHASIPLPARQEVFNYVNRLGGERVFTRDFLGSVNPGRVDEARRAVFADAATRNDLNRLLALDFEITLADNDLKKVDVMCREAGVGVEFPFLDDDVVDFSLKLTPRDKVNRTRLRPFFRKAVTGYLPDAVIGKSKHGFGLPFGVWSVNHAGLREWVGDSMQGARGRGVISPLLIDDLQDHLLREDPIYYGPLVWLIATLETWMQENTG